LNTRNSSLEEASRLAAARSLSASTSAAATAADALDDSVAASFGWFSLCVDDEDEEDDDDDEAFGGVAGGRPGNAMPSSSNIAHLKEKETKQNGT